MQLQVTHIASLGNQSLGNLIKAITMQRKPEIEAGLRAEIDRLLEQSTQRFRSGALAESLALGLQAWALIPEPKANWDYYRKACLQVLSRITPTCTIRKTCFDGSR